MEKKWALEYGKLCMVSVTVHSSVILLNANCFEYLVYFGLANAFSLCSLLSKSRLYLGMHSFAVSCNSAYFISKSTPTLTSWPYLPCRFTMMPWFCMHVELLENRKESYWVTSSLTPKSVRRLVIGGGPLLIKSVTLCRFITRVALLIMRWFVRPTWTPGNNSYYLISLNQSQIFKINSYALQVCTMLPKFDASNTWGHLLGVNMSNAKRHTAFMTVPTITQN